MNNNTQVLLRSNSSSHLPNRKQIKHFQLIEKTYQSNIDSDYTEKIADLGKNFDYSSNSNRYWGNRELSTLYGTPLYEEASSSQKLALNHLYMASGGSLDRALKNNIKSWKRFSRQVAG